MDDETIRCVCGYEIDLIPDHETPLDFAEKTIHPGRLITQDTFTGYEIIIPPKRSGLIYVRLGLYIIGCMILEALSMASYFGKRKVLNLPETETELLFLMGALAIGGGFMLYAWLWNHIGKEHIILTRGTLIIKKDIYGYGRKRVYDLNRMRNVCVSRDGGEHPPRFWGGSILFDYDTDTFRFGLSIDEGEAQFIVNEMHKRNPFRVI